MAIFLVFAQDTVGDPPIITYLNAATIGAADTAVQNALAKGIGVSNGLKGTIQYAIVAAGASGSVTPT